MKRPTAIRTQELAMTGFCHEVPSRLASKVKKGGWLRQPLGMSDQYPQIQT
jgi:hypothetical protein